MSRNAVAKKESNKGYPDIQNLIAINDMFEICLDDLVKNDKKLKNKIIMDSLQRNGIY